MTKRMLIDATHAEETRVVVLDGNRLEDFDVETSGKKQLKGNIYLAKVVRVEPSLQAAFVEYGGNRHGFLAFGEIHPDYYQIPVADRQRLIALQAEAARAEQAAEEALDAIEPQVVESQLGGSPVVGSQVVGSEDGLPVASAETQAAPADAADAELSMDLPPWEIYAAAETPPESGDRPADTADAAESEPVLAAMDAEPVATLTDETQTTEQPGSSESGVETVAREAPPNIVGGEPDAGDDARERRIPMQYLRNYKIQEVIRRRQILLVQVVKEERGTKGAALTTYISLAGRFSVLMPNSPRGGGISRKITSAADRRRLKEITAELEIPDGMGMIIRTAGANRPKPEIKRDCEYLLRVWDEVRETTLRSVAPALIHEEASLIKRAIRDVYSRDIEEILVDGEEGWRAARDFMRMLMPAHAQKVIAWRDATQPLFAKHAVEAQLDAMMGKNVQLRSGGYLVIDQTEALVSIDVNSGRSTRERGIEETALRTNLEAADEVARQLRLRDLAGLVVIDFIDMESKKHNAMVERRLQEALKADRARIQVGHISHFGLMEMSRQRLRPSLMEASLVACPHCNGSGHVRSTESAAIHILRGIEDEGARRRNAEIMVHVAGTIAMYILNHKRERVRTIELRYGLRVLFNPDATLIPPQMRIEKLRSLDPAEVPGASVAGAEELPMHVNGAAFPTTVSPVEFAEEPELAAPESPPAVEPIQETAESRAAEEENRRRRRRRRRGPRRDDMADGLSPVAALGAEQPDLTPAGMKLGVAAAQMEVAVPPLPDSPPEALAAELPPAAEPSSDAPATELLPKELTPVEAAPAEAAPEGVTAEAAPESVAAEAAPEAVAAEAAPEAVAAEAAPEAVAAEAAPEAVAAETARDVVAAEAAPVEPDAAAGTAPSGEEEGEPKARRRGRRGGRRRRRDEGDEAPVEAAVAEPVFEAPAPYEGPTPADPFGRQPFDIFDVMDQVEASKHGTGVKATPAKASPSSEPEMPPPTVAEPAASAEEPKLLPASNGLHLVETTADPVPQPEPLVKPVLINAPAQERKRGWWRR